MTQTLSQLENRDAFIERHIGPDAQQQQEMLKTVGADSLNALIGQIVPQDIQLATPPQVGDATTEFAALAELKAIASRNKRFKSYIGMGYTAVQLPPVIQRNMLENPAGIPPIPLTSRKYPRAVWSRCSTSSRSLWI
ncbi:glycine dehydrogenase [Klebsiella pneumoniae]|uniref:Glycine dehydrogenase n=1 Tax=Klebsiella pneumoniae TaxID=573 RepID=A0A2X3CMG9_KLEPN|nr:glycine dehydrogenase [Klebsiella pneumoniae]